MSIEFLQQKTKYFGDKKKKPAADKSVFRLSIYVRVSTVHEDKRNALSEKCYNSNNGEKCKHLIPT
jgi:hypothetical protein